MVERHEMMHGSGNERFGFLGTIALGFGLTLLVGRAIESADVFQGMPRFWYQNDSIWWLLSFASIGSGGWLLARAERKSHGQSGWKPTMPGKRFRQMVIYTRQSCPLCDEAEELVSAYAQWLPLLVPIDIDEDPQLVARFGTCVPILALDGKVRFRGRINETLLRRLIEGTPPED